MAWPSAVFAQDAPAPPALSRVCDAPSTDIAMPEPLPHLTAALQARRVIRVLAVGSSSTVGVGASSQIRNYPAQLEAILEKTFKGVDVVTINRGVSGEIASTTADRLKLQVALEKPDLVLWQVGTNDALARVGVDEFAATVRETLRWFREHEIDVVLVGLQYTPRVAKDEHYAAIRRALRDIASTENVLLVRRFEAMQFIEKANEAQLLSGDGLHLNDLGYRCMAEHIARAVVAGAFYRRAPDTAHP